MKPPGKDGEEIERFHSKEISVAMCTYNGERYLFDQLCSIARQSLPPAELVVCDDHSSDSTPEILKRFAETSPFPVRLIRNAQRLGYVKNFEKAIGLCQGDIIALSDQDDVWYPTKLQRLAEAMESEMDLVFSDADIVDEGLRPLGYRLWEAMQFGSREQRCVVDGMAYDVLLRRNVVTGATMAFRAHLRGVVLPIPPAWVHDGWIALLAAANGRITLVKDRLIAYRQHAQNQIGARRQGYSQQFKMKFSTQTTVFVSLVEQYAGALERQKLLRMESSNCVQTRKLEMKVRHCRNRLVIRQGTIMNGMRNLVGDLVSGNYRRYSRGWRGFIKDVAILLYRAVTSPVMRL